MNRPYVIAEVGQNHQGNYNLAKEYIDIFAREGANAVKFQMRNNRTLFTEEAFNRPYNSANAFSDIYGHHREQLELSKEELISLRDHCGDLGVDFMVTPFDFASLEFLVEINVDVLKIASFDIGNIPFIEAIARTNKPVIMSIGGGQKDQIKSSVQTILNEHSSLTVLHCVSEYPCPPERLGLSNIIELKNEYPGVRVGVSDHFNGTLSGPVARMLGAETFEKHVTLNRAWKGTDHSFALEREGFRKFVRDIHRVDVMLEAKDSSEIGKEPVFQKLGKSLVAKRNIMAGDIIQSSDLDGVIDVHQHIPVRESKNVIGKTAKKEIRQGMFIEYLDLK